MDRNANVNTASKGTTTTKPMINTFVVRVQKTNKVPDHEKAASLPLWGTSYQMYPVAEYPACPESWDRSGWFFQIREGDFFWIDFGLNTYRCAIVMSIMNLNPATGEAARLELKRKPVQTYMVYRPEELRNKVPSPQIWIDGFLTAEGTTQQFCFVAGESGLSVPNATFERRGEQDLVGSEVMAFAFFEPVERERVDPAHKGGSVSIGSSIKHTHHFAPHTWDSGILFSKRHSKDSGNNLFATSNGSTSKKIRLQTTLESRAKSSSLGDDSAMLMDEDPALELDSDSVEIADRAMAREAVSETAKASVGRGAGIKQYIKPDTYPDGHWRGKPSAVIRLYPVLPARFKAIMKGGWVAPGTKPQPISGSDTGYLTEVPQVTDDVLAKQNGKKKGGANE